MTDRMGETKMPNKHMGSSINDFMREEGVPEEGTQSLNDALAAGEESGSFRPFDHDAFLKRMRSQHKS